MNPLSWCCWAAILVAETAWTGDCPKTCLSLCVFVCRQGFKAMTGCIHADSATAKATGTAWAC